MTINDQIRDEKLQYDINREAAKISALSSGKIHKYGYLTGEDILPSNQQQIIEQARFTYSPLGKAFEKQIKTIEDKGQKQIDALESLKPKEQTKSIEEIFLEGYDSVEIKNELNKIKEYEKKVNRDNMIYYSSKEPFDFRMFKAIRSFGNDIYSSKITINEADQEQSDLVEYILNFNNKSRPKTKDDKKKTKKNILNSTQNLSCGRELVINACKSGLFPLKSTTGIGPKILTSKQMLQRLPIALAQVKAGNNSESLLNEIRQIVYSLYQSKQITKKVYNNIIKSTQ